MLLCWGVHLGLRRLDAAIRPALAEHPRYLRDFQTIVCSVPPWLNRNNFLTEVRYLSQLPARFSILNPNLKPQLRQAFQAHPWVARVEAIDIVPAGLVRVVLAFRWPQLQVRLTDGCYRAVDASGLLLPVDAPLAVAGAQVARLETPRTPPTMSVGQRWHDPIVLEAVQLVQLYRPRYLFYQHNCWQLQLNDGSWLQVRGASFTTRSSPEKASLIGRDKP
jgi:hypothetical protein